MRVKFVVWESIYREIMDM